MCPIPLSFLDRILILLVGLPAIFWLHMNWGIYFRDIKKTFLTVCNTLILGIACAIVGILSLSLGIMLTAQCALGLYVSGVAIHESSGKQSWSCAGTS